MHSSSLNGVNYLLAWQTVNHADLLRCWQERNFFQHDFLTPLNENNCIHTFLEYRDLTWSKFKIWTKTKSHYSSGVKNIVNPFTYKRTVVEVCDKRLSFPTAFKFIMPYYGFSFSLIKSEKALALRCRMWLTRVYWNSRY